MKIVHDNYKLIIYSIIAIFFTLFLTNLSTFVGANSASRLATIESLANRGTFIIDESPFLGTVDKLKINGNFYSSKPPTLSILLTGYYIALNNLFGVDILKDFKVVYALIILLASTLPVIISALILVDIGRILKVEPVTRAFIIVLFLFTFFGSGYGIDLNNHNITSLFLILSLRFWLEIFLNHVDKNQNWILLAICLGAISWFDIPSTFYISAFSISLFYKNRKKCLKLFIPTLSFCLLWTMTSYYISIGSIVPAYFNKSFYLYEGSYWLNPKGTDALSENKLIYGFNFLFGHHGIFSFTPILFLSFIELINRFFKKRKIEFYEGFILLSTIGMILLFIFFTNNYGGVCVGPRWLIPTSTIIFVLLMKLIDRYKKNLKFISLTLILGSWGLVGFWDAFTWPWKESILSQLFRDFGFL